MCSGKIKTNLYLYGLLSKHFTSFGKCNHSSLLIHHSLQMSRFILNFLGCLKIRYFQELCYIITRLIDNLFTYKIGVWLIQNLLYNMILSSKKLCIKSRMLILALLFLMMAFQNHETYIYIFHIAMSASVKIKKKCQYQFSKSIQKITV